MWGEGAQCVVVRAVTEPQSGRRAGGLLSLQSRLAAWEGFIKILEGHTNELGFYKENALGSTEGS